MELRSEQAAQEPTARIVDEAAAPPDLPRVTSMLPEVQQQQDCRALATSKLKQPELAVGAHYLLYDPLDYPWVWVVQPVKAPAG